MVEWADSSARLPLMPLQDRPDVVLSHRPAEHPLERRLAPAGLPHLGVGRGQGLGVELALLLERQSGPVLFDRVVLVEGRAPSSAFLRRSFASASRAALFAANRASRSATDSNSLGAA